MAGWIQVLGGGKFQHGAMVLPSVHPEQASIQVVFNGPNPGSEFSKSKKSSPRLLGDMPGRIFDLPRLLGDMPGRIFDLPRLLGQKVT